MTPRAAYRRFALALALALAGCGGERAPQTGAAAPDVVDATAGDTGVGGADDAGDGVPEDAAADASADPDALSPDASDAAEELDAEQELDAVDGPDATDGADTATEPDAEAEPDYALVEGTVVVAPGDVADWALDAGVLSAPSASAEAFGLAPGVVVVGGSADLPLLVRLVAAAPSDVGRVAFAVEAAALTDAFETLSFAVVLVEDEKGRVDAVITADYDGDIGFDFGPFFSGEVRADVRSSFGLVVDIRRRSLRELEVVADARLGAGIEMNVGASREWEHRDRTAIVPDRTLGRPVVFFVGPIPVVASIEFGVEAVTRVDAEAQVGVSASVDAAATGRMGFRYTATDGFAPIWSGAFDVTPVAPEIALAGGLIVEGSVRPELAVELYGAVGPFIGIESRATATIAASVRPSCVTWDVDLEVGVALVGGLSASFFGLAEVDWDGDIAFWGGSVESSLPCPSCGDETCDGEESCSTCPGDCGVCPARCGDATCGPDETCATCPGDCGTCAPFCGDTTCDASETCGTCASDCGPCFCGDGDCTGDEACRSCPGDCGACPVVCGDGFCDAGEGCLDCASDCGACPCDDLCPEAGATECVEDLVRACVIAESGCLDWTAPVACDAGLACEDGGCLIDPITPQFVTIPSGAFVMGSPPEEPGRDADEAQHTVTIPHAFALQATEVTQAQYEALMGENPATRPECGPGCPVDRVPYKTMLLYANALSRAHGYAECYGFENCTTGDPFDCWVSVDAPYGSPVLCEGYRLPTEAEWEYAARAGTSTHTYLGDWDEDVPASADPLLETLVGAWSSGYRRVGLLPANPWGLYDIFGNVQEIVWDDYPEYPAGDIVHPVAVRFSSQTVRRGGLGSGAADRWNFRAASRDRSSLGRGGAYNQGFRLARTLAPAASFDAPAFGGGGGGLVYVPGGSFIMGAAPGETNAVVEREMPQHAVTLTHGLWVQASEVTQGAWEAVMGTAPFVHAGCPTCPADSVNWWDAMRYANALSAAEGLAPCYRFSGCTEGRISCDTISFDAPGGAYTLCEGYRLPTEDEWEYLYRAGTGSELYNGDIYPDYASACISEAPALPEGLPDPLAPQIAWYCGNSDGTTHPVRSLNPNGFGLYDMAGNVAEWVWGPSMPYRGGTFVNRVQNRLGGFAHARGGHYSQQAHQLRAAYRPTYARPASTGFRLVRTAD